MKMSSPYVTLGNRPLEQWKVTELREELKKRKLTTKGLKEDLLKRLDEAVRTEQAEAAASEDDATQSDLPSEPENTEPVSSEKDKDPMDISTAIDQKPDDKPDPEVDDHRNALSHANNTAEADLGNETKISGMEQQPVETVVLSGLSLPTDGKGKDDDSTAMVSNNEPLPLQEKAKLVDSDPIDQPPPISESMDKTPPIELTIQGQETQNEGMDTMETDDSKSLQPDSSAQPYQVSEVNPDFGSQVTSDSVCAESVPIVEKNELKVGVITDNVKIELDVKHEMGQTSAEDAVSDGGKIDPAGDTDEPLDKKDAEQILDKVVSAKVTSEGNDENVDNLKNVDSVDLGAPEKLSLDRSSGDDSMEEDILDTKQSEVKSDSTKYHDSAEESGKPITNEDDHVDVVGHDKPVELKVVDTGNETVSAQGLAKRKFNDNEAMGHNDPAKKARRWNTEGAKDSEQQSGNGAASVTPKGSSEPIFKRTGSDLAVNEETPKERVVPPSSKPPTNSLRIDRFLRPFTLKAVQELLGKTGTVTSFWMDHIKTHCYVSYSSVEEAVETRDAMYNLQWPPNGGRLLVAEFVDPQEVKTRLEAPPVSPATTPSSSAAANLSTTKAQPLAPPQPSPRQQMLRQQLPPPLPPQLANPPLVAKERLQPPLPARDRLNLPPPPPIPEKVDLPIVTLDDLFRKTKATPRIYYLPLSDEQVAAKLKLQGKNVNP